MDFAKIKTWVNKAPSSNTYSMTESDLDRYADCRTNTIKYLTQLTVAYEQQQEYIKKVEEMNKQLFLMLGSPKLEEVDDKP